MLAHLKASEGAVSHLSMGPDAMMAINDVDGLRLTFTAGGSCTSVLQETPANDMLR